MSAYVRVLTFRRIILTVCLLHLASCSHYTWFILLNISYLCRGSLTPNSSPKGRGVITLKGVEAYLLEFNINNYIIMQTREQTTNVTNNSQATKSNHSPLFWRGVGGEAVCSMTRQELAQLAGVSERTLRRWIQRSHQQLIASGYQPSQRKLTPRVVRLLMDFYGIEK